MQIAALCGKDDWQVENGRKEEMPFCVTAEKGGDLQRREWKKWYVTMMF